MGNNEDEKEDISDFEDTTLESTQESDENVELEQADIEDSPQIDVLDDIDLVDMSG
ncbi:MAG: hypothetical protein BWY04_01123 [candidate division CPR1 bacterium ADurb.Bin160]|jgi:hypothetical protein|uniref:Uncharacterized protein n=1 Tax=candidate division CPR1 bacterium ADurb.Bin160 TaxID=1852826 RepID=A0A1V5ZLK7_9BACT|nr:MAG: hypothetical protein BWY04_01123 [candidate division CPR1 bacterium ADurb.Bin160]